MAKYSRSASEHATTTPEELTAAEEEGREPRHQSSLTEIAEDAARSGVIDPPLRGSQDETSGDLKLRTGDPDVDLLESESNGVVPPGAGIPTPDQNSVDDVGRVYGLTAEDRGALTSNDEVLADRDRHRWELDPRSKDLEQ